jgi:hypothetical protein
MILSSLSRKDALLRLAEDFEAISKDEKDRGSSSILPMREEEAWLIFYGGT